MSSIAELSLKNFLKNEVFQVEQSLEALAKDHSGLLGDLLSYVLINSGKRVRPALVMMASRLGKADPSAVRTVSTMVELIHIATLVHDDVIDHASLRRGRKTVASQHGVDTSVLLGDHIYTFAFRKLVDLEHPEILRMLIHATSLMCEGEIAQMENRGRWDVTEGDYYSFIQKKTAVLFGAAARSGAILAGLDVAMQTALESYGVHLGMAFQISDDLLDLTGDESTVGKTLLTDLVNGKMTLPLIHCRRVMNQPQQFDEVMSSMKTPNGQLAVFLDQLKDAGSFAYAESVARKHIDLAKKQIEKLPPSSLTQSFVQLSELLWRRKM